MTGRREVQGSSRGVEYEQVGSDYLDQRQLKSGAAGWLLHRDAVVLAGTVLFFHSAFDRVMGYGLKYATGFRDTHLGTLPAAQAVQLQPETR